jgi:dissimilatory sulfite reductase (desulfoviridin) alpha/beta subunit
MAPVKKGSVLMQWDKEAELRLNKAPFFVRKKVRQMTEDYVRREGRDFVTSEDVTAAKDAFLGRKPSSSNTEREDLSPAEHGEEIPVTAEEIARLEAMVDRGEVMEGLETNYHQVKLCGGAAGCPLSVIDDKKAAQIMLDIIEETKLKEDMAAKLAGKPILSHHKFKAAVAGCPNNCSEPQIKDFAIVGQRRPKVSNMPCSGCGLCLKACRERALKLENKQIEVIYENCLNCGLCIEACPKGVLVEEQAGYKITVGGRLGRHPRLAETLVELGNDKELRRVMTNCLELLKLKGRPGERLSHLVERIGLDELKKRVVDSEKAASR